MKGKRFSRGALLLLVALLALAACQKSEQLEEEEPTLEAVAQMTLQPAPSPTPQEPTQAPTEEPTGAPTQEPEEEATPEVEPAPTEVPATATTEMEEVVSVTDLFRVKVPAGWSSEETFAGGTFTMANSEGALERFKNSHPVQSGDLVLNVGFLPFELFRQREVVPLDIQFDATPDRFLGSLLPVFRVAEDALLSEPKLVSLSDERDAGLLTVSDEAAGEGRDGLILMFSAGDEVVAIVSAVGFPGEIDAYQEIIYAVASEVLFSGAQDVLYRTFLGG
jgi:hypothetical protein